MDPVAEWTAAYERVRDLVDGIDQHQAGRRVPACPSWTVRELLAHMTGLGSDVVAGDEPDDHNSAWTQRQVDAREDSSVQDLLAEWAEVAEPLRDWMREHGSRPLGDIVIHEQDLRGALGAPGAQDTPGLTAIRDRMVRRFADQVADLPAIALVGDHWTWCSGDSADAAEVLVRAPDFDLARALTARRSETQLRHWTTRGDVGPYLAAFGGLGPLPESDLSE